MMVIGQSSRSQELSKCWEWNGQLQMKSRPELKTVNKYDSQPKIDCLLKNVDKVVNVTLSESFLV